jgi:8-oxo-dGTP pyrophosphatase MutT (NUDIX family)
MKITAQVVLINQEGLVLGVSRKDDHTSMGLIGGKKEDIDLSPEDTAIRETLEETGLQISNLRLIFATHKGGYMGYTYLADYTGEINHNEPHVVKWVTANKLMSGSFGKYNKLVFESLDDLGVKYWFA